MSELLVNQNTYAVLPLRDVVVFPKMAATVYVGRTRSVAALRSAEEKSQYIFVVTQRDKQCDNPKENDLYQVGTICRILQAIDLQENTQKILVEGVCRAEINSFTPSEQFDEVTVTSLSDDAKVLESEGHLLPMLEAKFKEYVDLSEVISQDALLSLHALNDVSAYADLISVHITLTMEERQDLLEMLDVKQRVERVLYLLVRDSQRIKMLKRIRENVKDKFVKEQEKMLKMETLKAYKSELGIDDDPSVMEAKGFEKKLDSLKLTDQAKEKCKSELAKLNMMPPMSAEASVIRAYLDTVFSLPWGEKKKLSKDMAQAEGALNKDHYGLERVKDVILETMSVQKRLDKSARNQAPILCLVGPPGVGKTSLAKSIADAVGRDFIRISLGGVRDEAEIRGHRKTYIGAMP